MDTFSRRVEEYYRERFNGDRAFQGIYLHSRLGHYIMIKKIIEGLNISCLIDFGCAYGLLVELCNEAGMNAFGLDLPIDNLMQFHNQLLFSKGKFIYGSINDSHTIDRIKLEDDNMAITILDTLRHIQYVENIKRLKPRYIIIKENSNNCYIKKQVMKDQANLLSRLYSPLDCLRLFDRYNPYQIFPSKFIIKIMHPGTKMLRLVNAISPTYTLVLKRK